ncbi:MAG: Holliday junction branch migration protein RuvA [Clostridia bacterium]|nr:Holliday junction branch migration protein RuvA [Clostridia bacterium]
MFSFICGRVDSIETDRAIIEANGLGFVLICSDNTLKRINIGEVCRLYTHFQISQEAMALYGFYSVEEREMFRKIISVSKIGPKTALCALSTLSPADIALAVLMDNPGVFDKVSGIGKKTAARLILELKGTITSSTASDTLEPMHITSDANNVMRTEAVAALISLGYDGVSAGRAVAAIGECDTVEELIMLALKAMPTRG